MSFVSEGVDFLAHRGKGFTLVELVIVISVIGIVFMVAGNIIQTGVKNFALGNQSYKIQSETRAAAQSTLGKIRYSTAVYAIPQSSFRADNLAPGWDYHGVMDVTMPDGSAASEIVQCTWDKTLNGGAGGHNIKIVTEPEMGVTYRIVFTKDTSESVTSGGLNCINENNILDFHIEGYLNGDTSHPYMTVDAGTLALNSLQAVDYGTDLQQATAIAFRSDPRDNAYVAHVAMIMDVSGSMEFYMDSGEYAPLGSRRIDALQSAAVTLINDFGAFDNIDISLIPFSDYARPQPFVNTADGGADLINTIEGLAPLGGTNTGDAIRRAFYLLKDHNAQAVASGTVPMNYMIVLVDGATTLCSIKRHDNIPDEEMAAAYNAGIMPEIVLTPNDYLLDDTVFETLYNLTIDDTEGGTATTCFYFQSPDGFYYLAGVGNDVLLYTSKYVMECGEMFTTQLNPPARVFFIPMSDDVLSTDNTEVLNANITEVKNALSIGDSDVMPVSGIDALNSAFANIYSQIANDLWYLNGPKL